MGHGQRDKAKWQAKRARGLKEDLLKSHLSPFDAEFSDMSAFSTPSRAVSRASSYPPSLAGSDVEDDSPRRSRRKASSRQASRQASRRASRRPSPGNDNESEFGADDVDQEDLGVLVGEMHFRKLVRILLSKSSTRGADYKVIRGAKSAKANRRQTGDAASTSSLKEQALDQLCRFFRDDVFNINIEQYILDLFRALAISLAQSSSMKERELALQAMSMTAAVATERSTSPSTISQLKEACANPEDEISQARAIYAMAALVAFGQHSQDTFSSLLEYLIEIIESDGASVEAHDSVGVVSAAMEAWAFIATYADLHQHSDRAMEAFIEQLDSGDVGIVTMAASNIALMFEVARNLQSEAEDAAEEGGEPDLTYTLDLGHDPARLLHKMTALLKEISQGKSRDDKASRKMHMSYAIASLDLGVGYGYSTSTHYIDGQDGGHFYFDGYSETLHVGNKKILLKSWAVYARVRFLQSILGGGFAYHVQCNDNVAECLIDAPLYDLYEDYDHESRVDAKTTELREYQPDLAATEQDCVALLP